MPQNILEEVWDLASEDVETDFAQSQSQHPSVDVNNTATSAGNTKDIVRWLLIFLCLWSSFCTLSDNALEILLSFLRAAFDSLGTVLPVVAGFAVLLPRSVHLLRKQLGLDKEKIIKYVVCLKCHTLYVFDDCYELLRGRRVSKNVALSSFQITANTSALQSVTNHF